MKHFSVSFLVPQSFFNVGNWMWNGVYYKVFGQMCEVFAQCLSCLSGQCEQWLNQLKLDERAQSQCTSCLSSHCWWGGQERIETHANTVCMCVCVQTPCQCEQGKCRWAHIRSLPLSLYLSFLFSPQVMKAYFIQRPPFSSQAAASQRALIMLNFFFSIPRFLCFFSVCLSPALLCSHPIESEVS